MHRIIVFFIGLLCIGLGVCDARILNVPEDFQTIQTGIDSSVDGDTILIQPGEYHESALANNKSILLASNYIFNHSDETIAATIIDGGNRLIGFSVLHLEEGKRATVIGLTFTNCYPMGIYGLESNVTVSHCRFINNEGEHDTGGAIHADGKQIEIDHCLFSGNSNMIWGGAVGVSGGRASIKSCLFINNSAGTLGGALVVLSRFCEVTNCTFADNHADRSGGGILVGGRSQTRILNSIFSGNNPYWLATGTFEADNRNVVWIDRNDAEGGRDSLLINRNDTLHWGEGNIDADPLFLDPANGDFHLSANSPCIDTGDPDSPLDPDGTRADMGAFPFHQKDIEVYPREIAFGALPFGELDSQLVVVVNTGETDLTILVRQEIEQSAITMRDAGGDSIVIPARQGLQLWAIYRSQEQAQEIQRFVIGSNDPDEPEVTIEASVFANSVPSDNLQSSTFKLHSAFPNPFNGQTTLHFSVGQVSKPVRLAVYGLDGRLVEELWTGRNARPPQSYSVVWNAESLPAGVYMLRMEQDGTAQTLQAVLIR